MQNVPGYHSIFLENMNGAKGRLEKKIRNNTFILTAFTFFGQLNNFPIPIYQPLFEPLQILTTFGSCVFLKLEVVKQHNSSIFKAKINSLNKHERKLYQPPFQPLYIFTTIGS